MQNEFENVAVLIVEAGVRYWEDATVNGEEDSDGRLIPFREGSRWKPIIELESGLIRDWPHGTIADIHYKVCDAGKYWLGDTEGKKLWKWDGFYVPDRFLCPDGDGYGDYIILKVNEDGRINGWKKPNIDSSDWKNEKN